MGNLNTWDGPLSDEWQKSQIELQHQIINRMRELGMQPIAPAFAGFVPMAFAEKHPDIKFKHLKWGGFDDKFNAYVLLSLKKSENGSSRSGKRNSEKTLIISRTASTRWNFLLQKTTWKENINYWPNTENLSIAPSRQEIRMPSG